MSGMDRLTDEALEAVSEGAVIVSQARHLQIASELISARGELQDIEDMFSDGQGDDEGSQVLPDFEDGMSTSSKVEACLHLLERRRDVIDAPDDALSRRASKAAPAHPTEAMLDAARDWSDAKYGKPIGNDAAIGCWNAMLAAAPTEGET